MGRKRNRKQRVVVRQRHREELKRIVHKVMIRSVILAAVGGFALGMATQGDSFFAHFVQTHQPEFVVRAPQSLSALPLTADLPVHRFWLWFPGVTMRLSSKWRQKYSVIRDVRFERQYQAHRLVAILEPRVPLVRFNDGGLDDQGVVFPLEQGSWMQLPKAQFSPGFSKPVVGRWLADLSHQSAIWNQVAALSDDGHGTLQLDLQKGTQVIWGPPDRERVTEKAGLLAVVLDDAHQHLGGTGRADLRFFDEGRIIIRPKGH